MTPDLRTLANGVRVILDPRPGLASAALGLWIEAGARDEAPSVGGTAHFLEHMAFKGAEGRDARAFAEAMESLGAQMNAGTGYERTAYYARCLAEAAPSAFDRLAGAVLAPDLPDREIARERDVIRQEMAEARDAPDDQVFTLAQAVGFGDHELARPILGDPDSLARIEAATLDRFRRAALAPQRMIIGFSGAFDAERALAVVEQRFAGLTIPAEEPESAAVFVRARTPPASEPAPGFAHETRKLEQTHMVFSLAGASQDDPRQFATRIFVEIFGGGMSSRLFQAIREARGLAYAVDAFVESYSDCGRVGIYAGVEPARAGEAAAAAADILSDMAEHGPNADELARARTMLKAQALMSAEQPLSRLEWMAAQIFGRGRVLRLAEIAAAIDAVTAEDVRAAAQRAAANGVAAAAIGTKAGIRGAERFAARLAARQ